MDPALARAAERALAGDGDGDRDGAEAGGGDGGAELRARLEEFVALGAVAAPAAGLEGEEPARSLRPWLAAATDMGLAGLAALDYTAGAASRDEVVAALSRAEVHVAKVAVDVIPAFVRAVLGERVA